MKEVKEFDLPEGVYINGDTSEVLQIGAGWYFPKRFYPERKGSRVGAEFAKALWALKRFYVDTEYMLELTSRTEEAPMCPFAAQAACGRKDV